VMRHIVRDGVVTLTAAGARDTPLLLGHVAWLAAEVTHAAIGHLRLRVAPHVAPRHVPAAAAVRLLHGVVSCSLTALLPRLAQHFALALQRVYHTPLAHVK